MYGYAGGDPVNFSDPFGLCKKARADGQKCNYKTGDRNLDDPDKRQLIEDSYNNASTDAFGYTNEVAGACDRHGCRIKEGSRDESSIPVGSDTYYEWHTHPNVGRAVPDSPGNYFTRGVSNKDWNAWERQESLGRYKGPSYVVNDIYIIRIQSGKEVQVYYRFVQP